MIIDPHVHLRDWEQKEKETIFHGIETASMCGINAVFDMPNCQPTLTDTATIRDRLQNAETARSRFTDFYSIEAPFYAVYAGITADQQQIEEIVELHRSLFPRLIGLKLFAGRSTGPLAVIEPEQQQNVWKNLAEAGYKGTVAVHCEKESSMHPELWDPSRPDSHSAARPPEAEAASVRDQISFAAQAGFEGNLHICHISTSEALNEVRSFKSDTSDNSRSFSLSCGATPHHLLLDTAVIPEGPEGLLLKVNPPLRTQVERLALLDALIDGTVDWIESDHAPHTLRDKYEAYASGIPSMVAWPLLMSYLREKQVTPQRLKAICGGAVIAKYGLDAVELPKVTLAEKETGTPVGPGHSHDKLRTTFTLSDVMDRYPANGWRSFYNKPQ